MKKLFLISLCVITFTYSYSQSTDNNYKEPKFNLSFVPQYILISGMRIDLDFRLNNSSNWIILSPQYYSSESDLFRSFSYESLTGFGMFAYYRHYFSNNSEPSGVYIQAGLTYNFTRLKSTEDIWTDTEFDGAEAMNLQEQTIFSNINKIGGDILLGIQVAAYKNVNCDLYGGFGIRESIYKKTDESSIYDGVTILHPAFSGIVPVMGLRIGVYF